MVKVRTFTSVFPAQSVDLTASVFQNIEVDRDFWTYLVLDGNIITPAYYSIADAVFYDATGATVSTGIIIGQGEGGYDCTRTHTKHRA